MGTGLVYVGYQIFSVNYKQALFVRRDLPGVWPMVRHYFFFGSKPFAREAYNALQKQAYSSAIGLGVLSVLTGLAIWKPVQLLWLARIMGGFHWARLWHFLIMWAMLAFVFGHLVMVVHSHRWPPVPRFRIVWLNQRAQLAPRDNLVHLFQKHLSSCLFCVPLKTIHRRQSPLLFDCRSHLAATCSIFLWKGRPYSESP